MMWVRYSQDDRQLSKDPDWLVEFSIFFNKKGNRKKFEKVKKIFTDTYLENIREGMNSKEALKNAKSVALCFLMVRE
jgi:hypothetical protein